jgi:glucose-6-phosphate-specific signal transduction histidine kinase
VLLDATGGGTLRLEIVDDGRGLPSDVVPGVGLESMHERAEELGGAIVVEAAEGGGTRVVARLPFETAPRPAPRAPAVPDVVDPDQATLPAPEGQRA